MSIVRIAAAAAIIGALSVVDASAKSATVTAEVNLRKGPGTDTDVITLIPKGSTVEVDKCTNGWCQVKFDGQDGYAIAQNLGLGGPRPVRRRVGGPYGDADVVYGPGPGPATTGPGPIGGRGGDGDIAAGDATAHRPVGPGAMNAADVRRKRGPAARAGPAYRSMGTIPCSRPASSSMRTANPG